ncbi:MAG: glycosyltransferase family 2 protein [Acidobacteria bacterium]|nr:glycosyltransferase family 2 protein [Acidobacteriota bacterium]
MAAELKLSVVIATYRRCEVLRETLTRLAAQSLPAERFEVVVVDDGSPDDTPRMVEALRGTLPFALRFLRHENRGPGYTENVGIRAAAHDLVLLMADDIWAHPRMLEEHLATHARYPAVHVGVLGGVSQSPRLPPTVLHRHWDPFQYQRFHHGEELDGVHFMACNISVKRSFLLKHGLFLERHGAAHEDIELGYRLRERGLRLVYNANASAEHHHAETLDGICQRAYERGRNFDLLLGTMPASFALPLYKIMDRAAGWRACLGMLPRELPRAVLFNGLTVPYLWRPLLDAAERHPLARMFASSAAYRGVAGHYLRAGIRTLGPLPLAPRRVPAT